MKVSNVFESRSKKESSNSLIGRNGLIRLEIATDSTVSNTVASHPTTTTNIKNESKTYIKSLKSKAPLLVQKALYSNSSFPKMAYIYMMSSAGGVLQGDKYEIEIIAHDKTCSHITTQAATKIYKMESGYASQKINISLEDRGYLEFIPEQIIPYRSSRFYQEVNIKIGSNSTIIYSETIAAGRVASGEIFNFDTCFLRTRCYDKNDNIIFVDSTNIQPSIHTREEFDLLFDKKTIWSTIYIITNSIGYEKIDYKIDKAIKDNQVGHTGFSTLPNEGGVVIRILSNSNDKIKSLTGRIVNTIRTLALR